MPLRRRRPEPEALTTLADVTEDDADGDSSPPTAWYRRTSLWWATASTAIVATIVTIPWNMDEFIMYHALACREPSQRLNDYWFTERCANYPIRLGPWVYQRSYDYIGATSSLLLTPFRLVWSSIWLPFVLGAAFLIAIAFGLVRALAVPRHYAPLAVLWFPLLYAVIHDQGPVRISLLVIVVTPLIVVRCLGARLLGCIGWGSIIVTLWVVAMEDKPYFGLLIPGAITFTLASLSARDRWPRDRSQWRRVAAVLGTATAASAALLLVLRVGDSSYFSHIQSAGPVLADLYQGSASRAWTTAVFMAVAMPYFAHRVMFSTARSPYARGIVDNVTARLPHGGTFSGALALLISLASIAAFVGLLVWAIRAVVRRSWFGGRRTGLLLGAAFATWWLAPMVGGGWANHHFVYAQLALVGLVLHGAHVTGARSARVLSAVSALALMSMATVWLSPKDPLSSPEIPVAVDAALAAADERSILNCGDWGCYFPYQLLDRRNIPVMWTWSNDQTLRLETDAATTDRTIMHVCTVCTLSTVEQSYPDSYVEQLESGTTVWLAFKVEPRHDHSGSGTGSP
jgi:hypothetical protein